jgi:hypothetical protein
VTRALAGRARQWRRRTTDLKHVILVEAFMRRPMLVMLASAGLVASGCATSGTALSASHAGFGTVSAPSGGVSSTPAPRESRSAVAVARFVRANAPTLQQCHDDAALRQAAVVGSATLEVTLAEDGYVLRARVLERSWSGDGAAAEECILSNVRRWTFPRSGTFDQYVHTFTVTQRPAMTASARR